jgi:hypothetical protein
MNLSFSPRKGGRLVGSPLVGFFALIYFVLPISLFAQKSKATPKDVIVVAECVEYIGNGKFKASFGYDNQNNTTVSVVTSNSIVAVGPQKSNGTNSFKPGRQYNVFSKEFDAREVVIWTVTLPNGKVKSTMASANSKHCQSKGNIIPHYDPPTNGKDTTKIGPELKTLYDRKKNGDPIEDDSIIYRIQNETVLIEVVGKPGTNPGLKDGLYDDVGLIDPKTYGDIVTGWVPIDSIPKIGVFADWIAFVRPVYTPILNKDLNGQMTGLVETQGDVAQRSDLARTGFKVDGSGLKIGVLSDSYDKNNGATANVLNNDLPDGVELPDGDFPYIGGTDEGRAMMQIVHDVAPGAKLAFRTGYSTPYDFADGIRSLHEIGSNIIVDDITYITEPFLTVGVVSKAVNDVTQAGVSYFTSAGNFASKSYMKDYSAATAPPKFIGTAHNFGGGDILQKIDLVEGHYTVVMQWEDDYASMGTSGAKNDFDIYLVNDDSTMLYGFNRDNLGGDPFEVMPFEVINGNATTNILINRYAGTGNPTVKYLIFRGDIFITEFDVKASTIVGQANATGAMAVGAAYYLNTPEFGVTPPLIASYSSTGGTPLNEVVQMKPDFTAPSGGVTTVNMGIAPTAPNAYPFSGTSAAAPHAAGTAALIIEARKKFYNETLSPATVRTLLKNSAIDMGTAGFDFSSGSGLIQAHTSITTFATSAPVITQLVYSAGITPGAGNFTVTVRGRFFTNNSIVYLRGAKLTTTYRSATEVTAVVPAFTGNPAVKVYNPPSTPLRTDGGFSNAMYFFARRDISITADDKTKNYGAAIPPLTTVITGLPVGTTLASLGVTLTVTTPAVSTSDVDVYRIIPTLTYADTLIQEWNNFILDEGQLTIVPIPLKIQPNDVTIAYGAKVPPITFKYIYDESAIVDKGVIKGKLEAEHSSIMETETFAVFSGDFDNNEANKFTLVNSSFLATSEAIANKFTLVNGNDVLDIAVELMDTTAINSGSTSIVNKFTLVNAELLFNKFTLVNKYTLVNKFTLVNGESEEYFNENNNIDCLVIVDSLNISTPITELRSLNLITGLSVGTHWIAPAAIMTKNFKVTYDIGYLNVTPAPLVIKADNKTIKAGDPLPTLTSTATGLVNNQTLASVITAPVTHTVNPTYLGLAGTYQVIPAATLKLPTNYTLQLSNGTLYVNPSGASAKAIRPSLICVEELQVPVQGFYFVAHFGYSNKNSSTVYVPAGPDNKIVADGSYSGNVPEVFAPGTGSFDVYFDGSRIIWALTTVENNRKTSIASVASSSSGRCHKLENYTGIYMVANFPNPVKDVHKIFLSDIPSKVGVSIYNETTAKTYTLKASQGAYQNQVDINMSNLPDGFYYVRLVVDNKTYSFRVVKE